MLVLSRKKNQSIVIDGGIEIHVLKLQGGSVKIGVKAPDHLKIIRGELEVYPALCPVESSPDSLADRVQLPELEIGNEDEEPEAFPSVGIFGEFSGSRLVPR
jgi:carbon storage regulator